MIMSYRASSATVDILLEVALTPPDEGREPAVD